MEKTAPKKPIVDETSPAYFREQAIFWVCLVGISMTIFAILAALLTAGVSVIDYTSISTSVKVRGVAMFISTFGAFVMLIISIGNLMNNIMKHREAVSPRGYQPPIPPSLETPEPAKDSL